MYYYLCLHADNVCLLYFTEEDESNNSIYLGHLLSEWTENSIGRLRKTFYSSSLKFHMSFFYVVMNIDNMCKTYWYQDKG